MAFLVFCAQIVQNAFYTQDPKFYRFGSKMFLHIKHHKILLKTSSYFQNFNFWQIYYGLIPEKYNKA